jgi:hypothetical protein
MMVAGITAWEEIMQKLQIIIINSLDQPNSNSQILAV